MEEINIKDFFNYFKKYIFIVIIFTCLCMIGVGVYDTNIKTPLYKTYTTLVLTKADAANQDNRVLTQNDMLVNQNLVSTYSKIIKSKLVLEQVIEKTKVPYSVDELSEEVTVEALEDTEILKISVEDKSPENAKKIANTTAEIFSNEIAKIYQFNNISVVDAARLPKEVSNNTLLRDLVIAFLFGTLLTTGIIFIIYYFDDTVKLTDSLEEDIGLPVLAKIFKSDVKSPSKDDKIEVILDQYPKSLVSESIKTLRTNLQFSSVDSKLQTILVTSSIPGEGKSFVSANLAIAFTQAGKKVLLVDCDMRKGRQHKLFKVSNSKGLSNLLIDDITKLEKYVHTTDVKNLFLLTRGMCPPNPSELLNSQKNKDLIKLLEIKYDVIIFDGVPCNGLSDSIIMSTLVDKVLIVSAEGITPRSVLENTKRELKKVNAEIAGSILNKVSKKGKAYGKYYSYYGEDNQ